MKSSTFTIYLWVYLVVSLFVFIITSSGWTGLIIVPLMYGFILLVVAIISTILINRSKNFSIGIIGLLIVILFQIIAILFNYGDCADTRGAFSFFERLLHSNNRELCTTPPYLDEIISDGIAQKIALLAVSMYAISIIGVIYTNYKEAKLVQSIRPLR